MLLLAVLAVQADADPGAADQATADAQARAAKGDYIGAAAKYREAFGAEPRPELLCNVGVAYYKAKDLPRAQRYLEQCISIGTSLDAGFITNVKKVLAAVDAMLAKGSFTPVDLLVQPPSATTSVEGGVPFDEPILGSRRVWFPYGTYHVVVHAEGHVDRTLEIEAKDHAAVPMRVALERAPVATASESGASGSSSETGANGSGSETGANGSASESDSAANGSGSSVESGSASSGSGSDSAGGSLVTGPSPAPSRPSVVPPIIATALSGGVGAVALGYWLAARDRADQAGGEPAHEIYDSLVSDSRRYQHTSWVFGGIAGVGAVASAVLWYRYASAPRVELQATGSGAGVAISGRW